MYQTYAAALPLILAEVVSVEELDHVGWTFGIVRIDSNHTNIERLFCKRAEDLGMNADIAQAYLGPLREQETRNTFVYQPGTYEPAVIPSGGA